MNMDQALDFSLKRPMCGSDGASSSDVCSSPESSPKRTRHNSESKEFDSAHSPQTISSTTDSPGVPQSHMLAGNLPSYMRLGMNGALAALLAANTQTVGQKGFSMYSRPVDSIGNSWMTGPSNPMASSASLLGMGSIPDPVLFPTASLALSTLQRRRRSAACRAQTPPMKLESDSSVVSPSPIHKSNGAKVGSAVPDEKKDATYWERRKKNNEAAKRSRDTRRSKEEEIAMRAAFLEQENMKLRAQVTILKNETAKLQYMLFSQPSVSSSPPVTTFKHETSA